MNFPIRFIVVVMALTLMTGGPLAGADTDSGTGRSGAWAASTAGGPPAGIPGSGLSAGDWNQMLQVVRDSEYQVSWQSPTCLAGVAGALQAPNRAHDLRVYFLDDGVSVVGRRQTTPSWVLGLQAADAGAAVTRWFEPARPERVGDEIAYRRGEVTESFKNTAAGLGHSITVCPDGTGRDGGGCTGTIDVAITGGFDLVAEGNEVALRREDGAAELRYRVLGGVDARGREVPVLVSATKGSIRMAAGGDVAATYPITVHAQLVQAAILEVANSDAPMTGARLGSAVAVAGDLAAVGAPGFDLVTIRSGAVFLFHRIGTGWVEEGRLAPSDGTVNAGFGSALVLDDDRLAVGASSASAGSVVEAGAVYVYSKAGGAWALQAKVTATDAAQANRFGTAVALAGEFLAVGAPSARAGLVLGAGAVYLFRSTGTGWNQEARVTVPEPSEAAGFGQSVVMADALVVAGAPFERDRNQGSAGAVYTVSGGGGGWGIAKRLVPELAEAGARFGYSLGVDGGILGVGAPWAAGAASRCGAVYGFALDGGVWSQTVKLQRADCPSEYALGTSVAVDGGILVAGAPGAGSASGAAGRVHVWSVGAGRSFDQVAVLAPAEGKSAYQFGAAVALGAGTILAGGPSADSLGATSGAAWVFTTVGGGWTQQARLLGRGAGFSDQFGHSVAIDGDTVVIGARLEDLAGKAEAGAAYVFTRGASGWLVQDRVTAGDAAVSDQFGYSVAVSGDTIVVGAWMDDDLGGASGSAYVFERTGSEWQQRAKLTGSDSKANDFFGVSVDVEGDTAVIGSAGGSSIYVFSRTGGNWQQQQRLTPFARPALDYFGATVSLAGDTLAVAAFPDGQAAYVFVRQVGTWVQQARIISPEPGASTTFGEPVAVYGDTLVVGAPYNGGTGSKVGRAYVFERSGVTWQHRASLLAPGSSAEEFDLFGGAVAVGEGGVLVGASGKVATGTKAGAAYQFLRQVDGSWTLASTFAPVSPQLDMHFGNSVAMAAGRVVIGAPIAVNGAGASGAGVAYLYAATVAPPAAGFVWSPVEPSAGMPVHFTDTSTQNPATRLWAFGDGATSTLANPIHTFGSSGVWDVTLTVTNAGGSASITQVVTVVGAPPVARFAWSPVSPGPGTAIQFKDTSSGGPTAWLWDFGNGTTSTEVSPGKTYASAGTYTVSLTVSNALGQDTVEVPVEVQAGKSFTPTATIASVARLQGVGAFFTSRVEAFNAGTGPLDVDIVYTPRADVAGPNLRTMITVPSRRQLEVDDPLRVWFGLTDADRAAGTLRFAVAAGREGDLMVQSVAYARNPDGSEYGQSFPAVFSAHTLKNGDRAYLSTTVDAVRYRINLGVAGLVDGTTVVAVPVNPLGTPLAVPRSFSVDAGVSRQINDVNRGSAGFTLGDLGNYVVQLDVQSGEALAFVSVVDGTTQVPGTSDPTTILPVVEGSTKLTLLGLGPVIGINEFTGSASITNLANLPAVIRADFYARDDGQPGIAKSATRTLAPGETLGFVDIVGEIFGLSGVGAVVLSSEGGREFFATGRELAVFRDGQGRVTGTAGQLVPALKDDEMLVPGLTYHLLGLRERTISGALERSNLMVFNPGSQPRTVRLALFDGATGIPEGVITESIPAGELRQLNRVISRIHAGQDGQSKRLEVVADGAVFVVASRSNKDGDPVTIRPQGEGGAGR